MTTLITVSMNEVINTANKLGSSFFTKSNLNSFENTRVFHEAIYIKGSYYFVTANRLDGERTEGYTIRKLTSDGTVKVLGVLGGYKTYNQAMRKLVSSLSK